MCTIKASAAELFICAICTNCINLYTKCTKDVNIYNESEVIIYGNDRAVTSY